MKPTTPLLLAAVFVMPTLAPLTGCKSDPYKQAEKPQTTVIHQNPKKKSAVKYYEPAKDSSKD